MARVSDDYYEWKKAKIIDAALEVCKRKTVSSVSMQDIIDESGLSQGGIYRYYKNIDEILTDLLSRIRQEQVSSAQRLTQVIDRQIERSRDIRREPLTGEVIERRRKLIVETIREMHMIWAEEMEKFLYPHRKIQLEFTVLADNFPDRARAIFANAQPEADVDGRIIEELTAEIEAGVITPRIPLEDFLEYNAAVYEGIIKRAISSCCYQRNANADYEYRYDFKKAYGTFARSSIFFLGLEEYLDQLEE